jgi:drug/metabolite transporter (DMT)-like permease
MRNWLMFGCLGLIWGSSFLLIKIGLQELNALSLVSARLSVAALAFGILFIVTGKRLPSDRKTRIYLAITGFINTAIPFLLITWGENTIDSGLASVLDATVPLFSIVIAHVALHDDKIHSGKVLGLLTGFVGVVLLALRRMDPTHPNSLEGQLAVLVAAIFYACGAVFIRRYLRHVDSTVVAGSTMIVGAVGVTAVTALAVRPLPNVAALQQGTVLAMLTIGFVNTFIAYTLYFKLINDWGASRATMVTYVIPPVGLLLGALAAREPIDLQLLIGTALIVGGIALANLLKPPTGAREALEAVEAPPAGETAI